MTSRIKIAVIALLAAFAATFGAAAISYRIAHADDAGVVEAASTPTAAPADKLHDPVSSPAAAWDDVKAAKKVGWSVLVFAVLVMLAKLASRAKGIKIFAVLGKGKVAVVVGAVGALAASCYNAAAEGGAWTAMLMSGVVALGHYINAGSKEA